MRIYKDLMKQGWTMKDIDEMDPCYYFELCVYDTKTKKVYIDDVL